ncbi:MAG TPA: hypothetical protein VF848_00355 [Steroidobacteraceae bacterium]
MNNPTPAPARSSAPVLIVGMLQGLLLYWVAHTRDFGQWPGNSHAGFAAFFGLAFFIGPLIYGLALGSQRRLAWGFVALITALLIASGWQFGSHEWAPGAAGWQRGPADVSLVFLQLVLLIHAVPFLQCYLQRGSWQFSYGDLFRNAWQNVLQLALAVLFTVIFSLLLLLGSELFDMLGLPFLHTLLFQVTGYFWLLVAPAFGIGIHLVGSAERLLTALRQQVLTLLKWLVPVSTLILVAFGVALLARAPALMAEHRHVIRAVWLLWLVIVSVYLYNAAYQDGSSGEPYTPLLGRLLRWATPLLVLLAGMAAYDLWVRIAAYGLTPSRFWASIVAAIAFAYALGYSVAGLRAGPWMAAMGRANICVALGLIAILALTMTPLLSADRLAARSQAARLARAAGTAGPSDFMALRFDYGTYGYAELKRLAAAAQAPATIRDGASLALRVEDASKRWQFKYTTVAAPDAVLEAIPQGTVIDADLRKKILDLLPPPVSPVVRDLDAEASPEAVISNDKLKAGAKALCSTDLPCPVLFIDLDGDGQQEAIAFLPNEASVFEKGPGGWKCIGTADWKSRRSAHGAHTDAELLGQLRAGDYRLVEPHWKALEIGKNRLPMNLSDSLQQPLR